MKTVSKKEIINKLKELGYKATEKSVITSSLEKGYVLITDLKEKSGFIKIPAEKLGYNNYTMYRGYGYHGGGRPRKGEEAKRKTVSISGTSAEVELLKQKAEEAGKTVSRFIFDNLK